MKELHGKKIRCNTLLDLGGAWFGEGMSDVMMMPFCYSFSPCCCCCCAIALVLRGDNVQLVAFVPLLVPFRDGTLHPLLFAFVCRRWQGIVVCGK